MSLKDDLEAIDGVGEATAEKIMEVVEEHDTGGVDKREVERVAEMLERGSYRAAQSRLSELV